MPERRRERRPNGLDSWRAALLLMGVVMHAFALGALARPDDAYLRIPLAFTGLVRMEAFFLIAGLFSLRGSGGAGDVEWLRNRLVQVGAPLLFGVAAINSATAAITAATLDAVGTGETLGRAMNVRHLWFLQNLLVYALVLTAMRSALDYLPPLLARRSGVELVAGLAGVNLAISVSVSAALYFSNLSDLTRDTLKLLAIYAPCYAAGYLLGQAPDLRDRLTAAARPLVIAAAVLLALGMAWNLQPVSIDPMHRLVSVSIKAVAAPVIALAVVAHGLGYAHTGAWVARLSAASFTIYVVHILFLSGFILAMRAAGIGDVRVLVAASIALTVPAAYLFHHRVVVRHAALRLLFNGDQRDVALGIDGLKTWTAPIPAR